MDGSDGGRIHFVVLGMCADEADEYDLGVVVDFDDEAVLVALDIEYDPVSRKNVR
jgi:hypothetical protein